MNNTQGTHSTGYEQRNPTQLPPGESEGAPVKEIRTRKTRQSNGGAPQVSQRVCPDNSARAKLILWNDSVGATVLIGFGESTSAASLAPRHASLALAPGATFTIDNYAGEVFAVYTTAPAANEDLRITEFLT